MTETDKNITVGKYLISPLPKQREDGLWAISVSIRSGAGSSTHDRVVRLTRLFQDKMAAAEYAIGEGLQWIRNMHTVPHAVPAPV